MDKNKYNSDMEQEIKEICTELNDGKIAVVQATEKLLDLFSVVGQSEQLKAEGRKEATEEIRQWLIEMDYELLAESL